MWWFVLFYSGRTVRHYWSDLHTHTLRISTGFEDFSPFGSPGKESACQRRKRKRLEFHLWAGKIPWRRAWPPTPVLVPEKSLGQRSLLGYSLWDCKELDTSEATKPTCWKGLGAGGEGDDRGWDGWMASRTWWTWVWVNSGRWWWTGRPGVLWFMGLQRIGHNWATELNWNPHVLPGLSMTLLSRENLSLAAVLAAF